MNSHHIQAWVFKALLIGLISVLAWQSKIHFVTFDLTSNQRNSLSTQSIKLIKAFNKPITLKLFASPINENLEHFNTLIKRFQYHQNLVQIEAINPDLAPNLLRQYDIRQDGVLIIEFANKTEQITNITEKNISNALHRLSRQQERWIVFLEGHGERHPFGDANFDVSTYSAQLASKGFIIENINLTETPNLPENTTVLVITSPRTALLKGELEIIEEYIEKGGNLIWFTEPNETEILAHLADNLSIEFLAGTIVDPNSQLLGLNRIDYALINNYGFHPTTETIDTVSIFPQAVSIAPEINEDNAFKSTWSRTSLLDTSENTWNEVGEMKGEVKIGDQSDEAQGPHSIATALERHNQISDALQRVIIIGDGDFISNQFIGNGANAEIGFNFINWLSHDDQLIALDDKAAPDTQLDLNDDEKIILALGFLIFLPLSLILIGFRQWIKRKNK